MTDKQRLKEIRERREGAERVIREKGWAFANSSSWKDIDFLLSLVDSQAEIVRDLKTIVRVGTGDDPGAAVVELRKLQSDAATLMRNACVAKVREIQQRYRNEAEEANTDDSQLDHFILLHRASAASEILINLESLTLDNQE